MKQKYLLGMLLGGALLTACSVDDDLNLANVAQEANPSAPVFNLSFEDDALTRADYVNHKVVFSVADGDLLSLYNGINEDDMTTGGITNFGTYQNAVYEASGSDNEFKLTTRAMVSAGKAIMVYPVDTVNINPSGAPKISIKTTQNDETLKLTPYMSSVLKIEKRSEGGNVGKHEAGYGRTYDVKMKRAASLFALTVNLKETEEIRTAVKSGALGEPEILSVELTSTEEQTKLYTESIAIKTANKDKEGFDEEENIDPRPYWIGSTGLDKTNVTLTEKITTSAKDDDNTVFFTLLPFGNSVTDFSEAKLIVHTTYGDVAISGDEPAFSNPYKGSSKEAASNIKDIEKLTVAQFLQYLVAPKVSEENTSEDVDFKDEYVGKATKGVSVEIDLAKVDMSNMHIKTGAALKDAITLFSVIKAGKTDETAKFHLEGASEKDKTFEMNKEQWTALENQLKKEKNPITIALCPANDGEYTECEAIKLTADATEVIPDLAFTTAVDVQLNGKTWTYPSNPEFTGTKSLTLLADAVMELTGAVKVKNKEKAELESITIEKDAIVNVTGANVTLEIKSVNNCGTINIGSSTDTSANLYVQGADVILTNEAATEKPEDENGKKDNYDSYCWSECGKIYNYGGLAVSGSGKIYNYGLIESMNAGAKTLITQNAMTTETAGGVSTKNIDHSKTKIGSIVMLANNQTVAVDGEKGFIKYTLGAGEDFSKVGKLANYIIVNDNCGAGELDEDLTKSGKNLEKVLYLDINKKDFKFDAAQTNAFKAVIVRSEGVTVSTGVSVNASEAIYLTGTIFHAGVESAGSYVTWESAGQGTENFFGKSTGKLLFTGKKAE